MATNVAILLTTKDVGTIDTFKSVQREMDNLKEKASGLTEILGVLGIGLTAEGLIEFGKRTLETTAQLEKMTLVMGGSVESISELSNAAKISGTQFDTVSNFAIKLERSLREVDDPSKSVAGALKAMGVDAREANGEFKDTPTLIQEIAKAMQDFSAQGQVGLLSSLGAGRGQAAAQLIPFFKVLSDGIDLATVATREQARAAEEAEQSMHKLGITVDAMARQFTVAFVNSIGPVVEELGQLLTTTNALTQSKITEWADELAVDIAGLVDSFKDARAAGVALVSSFVAVAEAFVLMKDVTKPNLFFWGPENLQKIKDQFNTVKDALKEAGKDWHDFYEMDKNETQNAVKAKIAAAQDFAKAAGVFVGTSSPESGKKDFTDDTSLSLKQQNFLTELQNDLLLQQGSKYDVLRAKAADLAKTDEKLHGIYTELIDDLESQHELAEAQKSVWADMAEIWKSNEAIATHLTKALQDASGMSIDLNKQLEFIGRPKADLEAFNLQLQIMAKSIQEVQAVPKGPNAGDAILQIIARFNQLRVQAAQFSIDKPIKEMQQSLKDLLENIDAETKALGQTNAEREKSILLRALEKSGISTTAPEYQSLVDGINSVKDALDFKESVTTAKEAAGLIGSAFENAAVDVSNARSILDGLIKDLERLAIRKAITEPFEQFFTDLKANKQTWEEFFSYLANLLGGGSSLSGGTAYNLGSQNFPINVGSGTGTESKAPPINVTYNIDSRSDRAALTNDLQTLTRQIPALVQDAANRRAMGG